MSRGCGSRRFPPNRGGTVVGYCRKYTGMATGEAVVMDIFLRPTEIVPVSCQLL